MKIMKPRLIIEWKRGLNHVSFPPYIESFYTKTAESAMKIIDRRRKENMKSATFQGQNLLK